MSNLIVSDCLVLKLEEIESSGSLDTTLFILYDKKKEVFIIRGQRKSTPKCDSATYSFECSTINNLIIFLQYVLCKFNSVNESLYNYDNLPSNSSLISYEFLKENESKDYEISGYDNEKINRYRLKRNLRMLKNVNNIY